jgi:hypothetical protein
LGEDRLAVQGKRIPAGALESAHRDHYKSGAHKHRGGDGHRYFKRGQDDPVVAHGAALDGRRPSENNDEIWEPRGSFGLVRSDVADCSAGRAQARLCTRLPRMVMRWPT